VGNEQVEFALFYERNWGQCFRATAAAVGDGQVAEELLSEAFAKAWASWRKVSRHPAPSAWVVRTALNAGVSRWRRRSREVALADHDSAAAPADAGDKVDAALLAAVARMPARQREVIALRVFLDLDTETTAKYLGIAPGTVRAHLSRGVSALRHELIPVQRLEVEECTTTTK
jgi:RNA polymerase sigma factor (sigma-70 family)